MLRHFSAFVAVRNVGGFMGSELMNMRNQRGGFLSSIFIIPAGVVVIIAVFLLGYYVGKRQANQTAADDKPPALPAVVSQYLQDREELTFYKTLTEKGDKTLSIDLKQKPKSDAGKSALSAGDRLPEPGKASESNTEKPSRQQTAKIQQQPAREAPPVKTSPSKIKYTIQVGSYPEREMADENVRSMKRRGYAAFLVATEISGKGTWYRVRIGSFSNRQAAEKLAGELKAKEGIASFVTVE